MEDFEFKNHLQFPTCPVKKNAFLLALLSVVFIFAAFYSVKKAGEVGLLGGEKRTVVFKDDAYAPSEIEIDQGDIVEFKNESPKFFWPASNIHPTHGIYPEFDPKDAIWPGKTWGFRFNKVGTWKFHDHLHPYITGTIKVIPKR